jgi:hypothetical protein
MQSTWAAPTLNKAGTSSNSADSLLIFSLKSGDFLHKWIVRYSLLPTFFFFPPHSWLGSLLVFRYVFVCLFTTGNVLGHLKTKQFLKVREASGNELRRFNPPKKNLKKNSLKSNMMMHQHSQHARDKRGVQTPPEMQYLEGGVIPEDYAAQFLHPANAKKAGAAAERREIAPLLLRCLQSRSLQGIDADALHGICDSAAEWLDALGEEVDPEESDLAETLTLLVVHAFMLAPYRTSRFGDTSTEYGTQGSPADFDADRAAEFAEAFARRLVEARPSQDTLAAATAAAIYSLAQVAALPLVIPTFSDTIVGTLLRCPVRHRVLPLLPYVVPRPTSSDDTRSKALAAAIGGFVARALGSNDAAAALAAAEILPVVVEVYGAVHCCLEGVLANLESYPVAATQPDVPRGALKRALIECQEGLADPQSVDRLFVVGQRLATALLGFYGLRRSHFVDRLYRSTGAVPATIAAALFGTPITNVHAYNQSERLWTDHREEKARGDRLRDVARQRARDAKHVGGPDAE